MEAIVVRHATTKALLAFGPADGMYEPGFNPGVATCTVEPDYAAVVTEWQTTQPMNLDKRAQALANPLVPQWFKDYLA